MSDTQKLLEGAFFDTNGLRCVVRFIGGREVETREGNYFPRTKTLITTRESGGQEIYRDYRVTCGKLGSVSVMAVMGTADILALVEVTE